MKLYISADLEGVSGVVNYCQTIPNGEGYDLAVLQMHNEVNAVISGLFKAGATEIIVNDAHCGMRNLQLQYLDPNVSLITGKPKYLSMISGLDSTFDAAILLGYHAMAGSINGVLAHTFSFKLSEIVLNDIPVGEAELNSIVAAELEVPIMLITGDDILAEQIQENIGAVPYYITKYGISKSAAQCKPNVKLLKELESFSSETLRDPSNWILNRQEGPFKVDVSFTNIEAADQVGLIPHTERLSGITVSFTSDKLSESYRFIQVCSFIANQLP